MKKTEDSSRWEPAPINDKDVVWSFIMDALKEEHEAIENPKGQSFATWSSNGNLVTGDAFNNHILIRSWSEDAANEVAKWIADPINDEEGNDDLFAEISGAVLESSDSEYSSVVSFYYTDID